MPVDVFFSYSRHDESLRGELETHLALLESQGSVRSWSDRQIDAGDEWRHRTSEQLEGADLILLLVSADFLASPYCRDVEMTRALQRHHAGEARVIPIVLRACDLRCAPFEHLPRLPAGGKPVKSWSDRDEAWTNVAAGIREAAEEILRGARGPGTPESGSAATSAASRRPGAREELRSGSEPREEPSVEISCRQRGIPLPDVGELIGRDTEVSTLKGWIVAERCSLALLLGMGGIGKTTLARAVAEDIQRHFDYICWQDLRNAPPLLDVLEEPIKLFSGQRRTSLPDTSEKRILLLLELLRDHRCLLILDNVESIFEEGTRAGLYRDGFSDYGRLLRAAGEGSHQSCLLLTSREPPSELKHLAGLRRRVRALSLGGLDGDGGRRLLAGRGLRGSEPEWSRLIALYRGNPLALNLMAGVIQKLFDGELAAFLREGVVTFGDVDGLLREHLKRLPGLGIEIVHWLAVERDPVTFSELAREVMFLRAMDHERTSPGERRLGPLRPVARKDLLEALDDLQERSLIEKSGSRFTLQPVVMDHVTALLIDEACQEIASEAPELLARLPLLKAQTKEYVRESQVQLIVKPIADRLRLAFGEPGAADRLTGFLALLRARPAPGYLGGNILNLLMQLGADVSGGDFSRMYVWNADLRGKVLRAVNFAGADLAGCAFTQTFGIVLSLAFSPDGSTFAAGTADGEIRVWDSETGNQVLICTGHAGWVSAVAYTPDGARLVSGSWDRTVRVWDSASGLPVLVLSGHTDKVRSVACSPDGRTIASGGVDETVRVWDAQSGALLLTLHGHAGWVTSVAFSPDGRRLASAGSDGTVRLWGLDGQPQMRTLEAHPGQVWAVAFAPDGARIASGWDDGAIQVWDLTGEHVRTLRGHTNRVKSISFSRNGKLLVSGSTDHTVRTWEVDSGECLNTFIDHTNWVDAVAFSPVSDAVLTGSSDQSIRLWSAATGQRLLTFTGHAGQVWCLAFSPSADLLASGGDDHLVRLWNAAAGTALRVLSGHRNRVRGLAFSPDGIFLASASHDRTVRLWDTQSGACRHVLRGHADQVWSVAFSPDGRRLASGSNDETVRIWDVGTGECRHVLRGRSGHVRAVAFSPDGSRLAAGGPDPRIHLWSPVTGDHLGTLREPDEGWVWSLAFAPDGRTLASAGTGTTVRLWDVHEGTVRSDLKGHMDRVWSLCFAADGRLASGSEDATMRVWDSETGACLHVFEGHAAAVWSVAFGRDGGTVASAGGDNEIRVYSANSGSLLHVSRGERPYAHTNIAGVTGLTGAQIDALVELGAVKG
ncbi:TIR domain-containing protein [Sorangium sp. So ce1389]|uniref:WD40 domain-containing protein n=1 Tax=Sorangium sp. So ce1389 TaxID=3133336 RepID=UPI003F63A25E